METIFKIGVTTIVVCLAFFFVRLLVRTIKDDNSENETTIEQVESLKTSTTDPLAYVKKIDVKYDNVVDENGESGMKISAIYDTRNMNGLVLSSTTVFLFRDGSTVVSPNGKQLGNYCEMNVTSDSETFTHNLVIPYSIFPLVEGEKKNYAFLITLSYRDKQGVEYELSVSDPYYFHLE